MAYPMILIILSTLVLHSCSDRSETRDTVSTLPRVEAYICEISEYSPEMSSFGVISPVRKADILPPSESIIRKMYFNEGDMVCEGDILAELDLQQIDLQIKEAEASLQNRASSLELSRRKLAESRRNVESRFHTINSAEIELSKKEAELNRMSDILSNKRRLYDLGGITKDELLSFELNFLEKDTLFKQARCSLEIKKIGYREMDLINEGYPPSSDSQQLKLNFTDLNTRVMQAETEMAVSELESARNSLESLRLYREENTIRSPLSGIVVRRLMDEGEKASSEKPIYHICAYDQVYASCRVSENDLISLKLDQTAVISSPVDDRQSFGSIKRISPWIESDSGSGEVMILLDNRDGFFRFGQFVQVSVDLGKSVQEIVIPSDSLFEGAAYLLRDNHIFRTDLTTGTPRDGMIPVYEGLAVGDRIVLSPHNGFIDGMEVSLP